MTNTTQELEDKIYALKSELRAARDLDSAYKNKDLECKFFKFTEKDLFSDHESVNYICVLKKTDNLDIRAIQFKVCSDGYTEINNMHHYDHSKLGQEITKYEFIEAYIRTSSVLIQKFDQCINSEDFK